MENGLLSLNQFNVLRLLTELPDADASQRKIANSVGYSVGKVNSIIKELCESGLITPDNRVSGKGFEALEEYRVKRAVIIAAGFGSRLVPITLNTPKPLVRVHGVRIIDSLLDSLVQAGIEEVWIVRGYLSEQFDQLLRKYPFVRFIENENYNESNNISSVLIAKDKLESAYVCEADLLVRNHSLISKYQYSSNVLGVPVEETDDWCFMCKGGIIKEEKVGGRNCHREVGITYLSEEDGRKLSRDIVKAYSEPGGKELFWEQVLFKACKENYDISVRECCEGDVIEIDTFRELKLLDKSYDVN